ncbi:MAG: thiol peroxidase [Planctomycetes bacterium]|nr:thiol peroxidase [Planctomycetota bacterium]
MVSITLKGNPVKILGEEIRAGQRAPDYRLQLADMSDCTATTHAGKTRILCAVPSLDTGVCNIEMQRFNKEAAKLANAVVICVSMDLPFAQKRWCGANGVEHVITASDHRDASFGRAYGCLVSGGPLDRCLGRAVFVAGPDGALKYVEYVPEITQEPNYEAVLKAAAK